MHSASLGEFEQGRPVLQQIIQDRPGARLLITFFSPSGYEIAKKQAQYDGIFYLPMDSALRANKFLNIVKPSLVLWVKYEYWHYYLQEIKKRNIPLLMVSGIYRADQIFFRWYGGFYRNMLHCFTHFFLQNEASATVLSQVIHPNKITVTGDTRCDRVIQIASNFTEVPGIAAFCGQSPVIVAGSTWEDDEAEWTHFVKKHPQVKFIIAPHEIDAENLHDVKKEFSPGSIFYSEWIKDVHNNDSNAEEATHCLIIDNIGLLSRLYRYADITYVGGGFGDDGLHNILEAAVYGKPVLFGPHFSKHFEAQELIDSSGAISIEHAVELEETVKRLFNNAQELKERGDAAKKYIYSNAGAAKKIANYINNDMA